jgi:hypothetical protein
LEVNTNGKAKLLRQRGVHAASPEHFEALPKRA